MSPRSSVSPALAAGFLVVCGVWAWALVATPDASLVLDGKIAIPVLGVGIPARPFLILAPLLGLLMAFAAGPRGRWGAAVTTGLVSVSLLNALRSIKLHDAAISYLTAGLALMATFLAARLAWSIRPFQGRRVSGRGLLAFLGSLAAAGAGAVLLFIFVPWSFRGDLPKDLNNYPFGPAVRRLIFAELAGLERSGGPGGTSLRGAQLEGADLNRSMLGGADLRGANLLRAKLNWSDLEGAKLAGAVLTETRMSFCDLGRADLSGADLSGNYALGADLRGAVLRRVGDRVLRFIYSDCRGADFTSARLIGSTFFDSDCRGATFRDANMTGAFLTRARFDEADLRGADLSKADLRETTFRDADLSGAVLSGVLLLGPEALSEARSLRGATLDPPLRAELVRLRPGLF